MNASAREFDHYEHPAWRRPAPRARAVTMALYSWQDPAWIFVLAILAAAPFVLLALLSPALLSLAPAVEMIAPVADARAVASGAADLSEQSSPLQFFLLLAGDVFFEAPGRIHLAAKAIAAALVAYPLAWFASVRFPAGHAVVFTASLAAFIAAPFAGLAEIAVGLFVALAVALLCAPADETCGRARAEGAAAGALLFLLWIASPAFALLGFIALTACPFLTGRRSLDRYGAALLAAIVLAGIAELFAPGLNLGRANAASGLFAGLNGLATASAWGLAGVAVSAGVAIFASLVFGGREHWRAWAVAAGFLALAVAGARLAGAQAAPIFALAAAMACFSVASPFYDGVFRTHDRASIGLAGSAAALTLFATASIIVQACGQFALQFRATATAAAEIRDELGFVQPGGPMIAAWIVQGRFSTPEAKELFALAPIDQSMMLLEAAARARVLSGEGVDVAILTASDTACVIAAPRPCQADGPAAAREAKVVFVPRLDLDKASAAARGRAEALLYTEFRMVELTPLWEIWVRRGASLPGLTQGA